MTYAPVPVVGQTNNGMAVAAMILGIVGLLCIPIIPSILGVVFGFIARKQINESGGMQQGEGMALAGIITGLIGAIGWTVLIVISAVVDNDPYWRDSLFTMLNMSMPLLPLLPFL